MTLPFMAVAISKLKAIAALPSVARNDKKESHKDNKRKAIVSSSYATLAMTDGLSYNSISESRHTFIELPKYSLNVSLCSLWSGTTMSGFANSIS